ncbi:MAG: hypothetical protein HY842_10555 [Bacteroidetes bacterium]|nr:hypothetical protein [Bacteroidota bacterium]
MSKTFTVLLALLILCQCSASRSQKMGQSGGFRIAFYNVENLFDTVDDPAKQDEEFMPGSKKKWTPARYQTKLDHLARVVEGMGFPALLGLAEVENATVLKDFCKKTSLAAHGYCFAHFESPDVRGIDVALLYRRQDFKVLAAETIRIDFPAEVKGDQPNYVTRDVLVVRGVFQKKDTLNVLVAHFPSRTGGQKESEPKRLFVAKQVRKKVDEILRKNPNANVVVMGDLNDEPTDPSVAETLAAQSLTDSPAATGLYDCMSKLDAEGKGTYNFRGDWNMLDHIILSGSLLTSKRLHFSEAAIFQQDWMMYTDEKYGKAPSRTYGGDHYFGGYSDHLPVFVEIGN